ncbi:MAG: hypothetical protein OWU32_02475 [Firmicutes bacterium]|nr:hypothetical protein [Bacillota bacterium]
MPLPMVHMAVAVRLYEGQGVLPPSGFLLGSLAPDAIHARPGTQRADKDVTHFLPGGDRQAFLARVRAFGEREGLSREGVSSGNPASLEIVPSFDCSRAFAAGYLAHVLTDAMWGLKVYSRFRQAMGPDMPLEERRSLYYLETEKVDFLLHRGEPWVDPVWDRLRDARPCAVEDLLTETEVLDWQRHILGWFATHEEPDADAKWITESRVRTFVSECANVLARQATEWSFNLTPAD